LEGTTSNALAALVGGSSAPWGSARRVVFRCHRGPCRQCALRHDLSVDLKLDLSQFPKLQAFQKPVSARPAVQEALRAEGLIQ
jgi:hypothetical protein